jgi:hypothetical protein
VNLLVLTGFLFVLWKRNCLSFSFDEESDGS